MVSSTNTLSGGNDKKFWVSVDKVIMDNESEVVFHSLKERKSRLNGKLGEVVEFDVERGR